MLNKKQCHKCTQSKPTSHFADDSEQPDGKDTYCALCRVKWSHKERAKKHHTEKGRERMKREYHDDPRKVILQRIKRRAEQKQIPFNLVPDDIIIPIHCPVFGNRLEIGDGKPQNNSPSVDRIDNKKGYTRDNIIVVSWRVNNIKKDATLEELEKICSFYRAIAERREDHDLQTSAQDFVAGCRNHGT